MMSKPLCRLLMAALIQIICLGAVDARPRVGLVLGGGGARGAAHIGVLKVLQEKRVPVDCVAGTSMGALVSGALAAGLTPDEMLSELDKANWKDMFDDNPDISNMNSRRKRLNQTYIPGLEMGVSDKGLQTLPGVVDGQKIKLFFNRLVRADVTEQRIERLGLPLSIIATDIGNGERVVFREGSLTAAMRSSMSVPGAMAPYTINGRKLVDGGLVDNVPVQEVRERCQADIVIAVNVSSPLLGAGEVSSVLSVTAQMVNILTEQNVKLSLASLGQQDVYLQPNLDGISAADFGKFRETAERGRAAAETSGDRLAALSVDQESYDAWWRGISQARTKSPPIDEVEVAGLKYANPAFAARHLRVRTGVPLDSGELDDDLLRIYGDGFYESVDYEVLRTRDRNILRVTPIEKSWGPDYLRLGLNLQSAVGRDNAYNVRAAYHKTWMNSLGGELLVAGQVGSNAGAAIDWYQPLDAKQRFFVQPAWSYSERTQDIIEGNKRLAQYGVSETRVQLMGGINVGLLGPVRFGYEGVRDSGTLEIGTPNLPQGSVTRHGWRADLDFQQFDRLYFPTRGWAAKGAYFRDSGGDYDRLEADLRFAVPMSSFVLSGRGYTVNSLNGKVPFTHAAALGGFLNLSGFVPNQVLGERAAYGHLRVEKILGQMPLGLRGDLRVGAAIEAGRVDGRFTETRLDGWQNSIAIYLGAETPLGATYLGYGYSPNGTSNVYLFIGTP